MIKEALLNETLEDADGGFDGVVRVYAGTFEQIELLGASQGR